MTVSIVPAPRSARETGGPGFRLDDTTTVSAAPGLEGVLRTLQAQLRPATGLELARVDDGGRIRLDLDAKLGSEAYRLTAAADGVRIVGGDPAGVFAGVQTLRQLLPVAVLRQARVDGIDWTVPAVEIDDAPRFGWRGIMLDVARHFLPPREVRRAIDLAALHRLNSGHLHLTDDQGWRIPVPGWPKLTEISSWRRESQLGAAKDAPGDDRPHGGFYTTDDLRELVAYAEERFVRLVPEVDVPGHTRSAIAAYPELGVTGEQIEVWTRWGIAEDVLNVEESTVRFVKDVLDAVMDVFPGEYIGVGGDECPKVQWKADPRTQERMREVGAADEEELQSWFIGQLDAHITAAGRRTFGWDEILEGGIAPGATVASWRGMTGALTAARSGHDVVSCPDDQVYLDYRQSEDPEEPIPVAVPLTVRDVWAFDPVPAGLTPEQERHILGGQGNGWSEHMDSPRRVDYQLWPRVAALAETLWLGGGDTRDWDEFAVRFDAHLARLDALGVEYRHPEGPLPWEKIPGIAGRPSSRAENTAWREKITANIASAPTE